MTRISHPRRMIHGMAAGPVAVLLMNICTPAIAQNLLNADPVTAVNLLPGDQAVLEMEEVKKDLLPCTVTLRSSPLLGFDLRFHSGYEIAIPLKELAGSGQTLTVLFPLRHFKYNQRQPSLFFAEIQGTGTGRYDDAGGKTLLEGGYDVGEGKSIMSAG